MSGGLLGHICLDVGGLLGQVSLGLQHRILNCHQVKSVLLEKVLEGQSLVNSQIKGVFDLLDSFSHRIEHFFVVCVNRVKFLVLKSDI